MDLFQFGLTAFVTLIVVVDPFGVVPIFAAVTKDLAPPERRAIIRRAVLIAFGVALFFLIAGRTILSYLGVTVHAFAISGGVLLFATALPMLFGQRSGLQAQEPGEKPNAGEDVAVFPLAIPMLSGPGTIATVLLLTAQADGAILPLLVLGAAVLIVYLIAPFVLLAGDRFVSLLGEGKMHILTRVLGIILAALAVQYVLNGITEFVGKLK